MVAAPSAMNVAAHGHAVPQPFSHTSANASVRTPYPTMAIPTPTAPAIQT